MSTWKKTIGLTLVGLGLIAFGATRNAQAAVTDDVYVTVTVEIISVAVDTTTWAIGTVAVNTINVSSEITVTNDGNRQEDFSLNSAYTGGWSSPDETPGADQYAMMALFTDKGVGLIVDGDFGSEDLLSASVTPASSDDYAITGDAAGVKGYDVGNGTTRLMHLNFRAPTSNTEALEQTISVTVTAAAG